MVNPVVGGVAFEIEANDARFLAQLREAGRRGELALRGVGDEADRMGCLLYTSPSPRDQRGSRMPSSA